MISSFVQNSNNEYFKNKLIQTINFINSEFITKHELYGSAYDADSDGIEGKYYIWKYDELKKIIEEDLKIFEKK